ncbi:MAG: hypothetical protein ABFS39_00635 [Pseudomonadota bacterium]
MAEILPFKKKKLSALHKGKGLCREGFHKWEIVKERVFDVKQGRLLSEYCCSRCGKVRTRYL